LLSARAVSRCYKEDSWKKAAFREYLSAKAEKSPLLEAVAVVIGELWRLTVAL
jgi:hypothetical protein